MIDRSDDGPGVWEPILRAYAASLDEHRSLLVAVAASPAGHIDFQAPPPFVPPEVGEPIPAALIGWAKQLMIETDDLASVAADVLGRPEPARPARVRSTTPMGRSTLDTSL